MDVLKKCDLIDFNNFCVLETREKDVTYLPSHFHLIDLIYQSSSIHFMLIDFVINFHLIHFTETPSRIQTVVGHDTVQTEDIKQQVELLQNQNNRLRMESESLFKVIEL